MWSVRFAPHNSRYQLSYRLIHIWTLFSRLNKRFNKSRRMTNEMPVEL
jgi:hypothetical protein